MVFFWYGLAPVIGAFVKRYKWYKFRKRFDELRMHPILDYSRCWQKGRAESGDGANLFRFIGGFESVTDGQTLWISGEDLTIPVSLKNAEIYFLPTQKGEDMREGFDPGEAAPEKIRWEKVSALTEGARVFAGGPLVYRDDRWSFVSTKENPLIVIFFDGPDRSLTVRAIRAGRQKGEYWNAVTPYSLVIGALCQILMAFSFLSRPAFRLTVIVSFIALFTPLFPMIPPGLLLTVLYRRLAYKARILRTYSDLVRLPVRCLSLRKDKGPENEAPSGESCCLPGGELYGFIRSAVLPPEVREGKIPLLLPEFSKAKTGGFWYLFGALRPGETLPSQPEDPFASFGILPGRPEILARRYMIRAYTMEVIAWLLLLAGIGLNIFFLRVALILI